jgi:hypothetical protein
MDQREFRKYMKAAVGECPDDATLLRYATGEADDAQRLRIEAHVRECALCAEALSDARDFTRPEGPGESVSRFETAASLRAVRAAVKPDRGRLWLAIAAGIAGVAVATSIWALVSRQALRSERDALSQRAASIERQLAEARRHAAEPQLNARVIDLIPSDTVVRSETAKAPVSAGASEWLTVILNGAPGIAYPSYEVSIRGVSGNLEYQAAGLQRTPQGAFLLTLPAGALVPGKHRIEVYAVGKRLLDYLLDLR